MNKITEICQIEDSSLLTMREVADLLRVDHVTVRRWTEEGSLEVVLLPQRGNRKLRRIRGSVIKKILKLS